MKGNIKGTWRLINNVLQDVSCSAVKNTIMEIKSCGNIITNRILLGQSTPVKAAITRFLYVFSGIK